MRAGVAVTHLDEIRVGVRRVENFAAVMGEAPTRAALRTAASLKRRLDGRVLWNVNSTAVGGGVAEMLRPLLAFSRGAGIDTRWMVLRGNPAFFRVTKRLHHALHGSAGDGSPLGEQARAIYEKTLSGAVLELVARVKRGDVVLLHDPQTAGLAPALQRAGAHVIWRCHVGDHARNDQVERGWTFLFPYLKEVPAFVFSRESYVPSYCDHGKSHVIQPSIDAFSPKNQELDLDTVRCILADVGLVEGPPPPGAACTFRREDDTPGRVERRADVVRHGRAPSWETPLVVQVSRWDLLKDPIGVMLGFATLLESGNAHGAELVLAGPDVLAVADDPEGAEVYDRVVAAWRTLPEMVRARVHLACLPTADVEENAAIVNALQRHATVVVQKSLQEGFGLTVTEAMWKGRPVVASAVGGIQDQIEDGVHGLLLADPGDRRAFASALQRLLEDGELARRIGAAARERVRERFLGMRHLLQYARLFEILQL